MPQLDARRDRSENEWVASCPHCGYSQRGAIEAWQDTCPLEGCCTECGLTFAWTDVLRPNLHEPRWCFEYARGYELLPVPRLGPTIVRSFWPWWFWRSIKMSHPIRPGRLIAYALILVVAFVLLASLGQAALAVAVRRHVAQEVAQENAWYARKWTAEIKDLRRLLEDQVDMEDEKSKRLQEILDGLILAVNALPSTVNMPYAVAIREAVLTPWSSRTRGFVTGWGGWYPAPRRLHRHVPFRGQKRAAKRLGPAALGLVAGLGLIVLMPISFVLLPASRHKAKVRWGHIMRVFAYSLVIPAVLGSAAVLLIDTAAMGFEARTITFALTLVRYAPGLFVILWWAAAIRNYLRMPHAWTLAASLAVLDLLLMLAVLCGVAPDTVVSIFGWSML